MEKEKKDLSGSYGWNVSNFVHANGLHDLAREHFGEDDMTDDEIIELLEEFDVESGWNEILGDEYIHHYPHPSGYGYGGVEDDYCLIQSIEEAEKEALEHAKYIFSIRGKYEIIKQLKTK
jgi:hypothetical protein